MVLRLPSFVYEEGPSTSGFVDLQRQATKKAGYAFYIGTGMVVQHVIDGCMLTSAQKGYTIPIILDIYNMLISTSKVIAAYSHAVCL